MAADARTFWEKGHLTSYVEVWDGEVTVEKPTVRPDGAWVTNPVEAKLTVRKPGTDVPDEIKLLTSDPPGVAQTRDGEYRARGLADAGGGDYVFAWEVTDASGYVAVDVVKVKVKAWPEPVARS